MLTLPAESMPTEAHMFMSKLTTIGAVPTTSGELKVTRLVIGPVT